MNCDACGKYIEFVRMKSGRCMPVDGYTVRFVADPDGQETFITPFGETYRGYRVAHDNPVGEVGFIPHWATCANPGRLRKGGGRK